MYDSAPFETQSFDHELIYSALLADSEEVTTYEPNDNQAVRSFCHFILTINFWLGRGNRLGPLAIAYSL